MSYEFYKVLHLIAVFAILLPLGGMAVYMANGGSKASFVSRKFLGMVHGIGLLVALIAGFGLLARLGMSGGIPGWVVAKLVIWLFLGALPAVIYKKPKLARVWFVIVWILAALAASLAIYKPF